MNSYGYLALIGSNVIWYLIHRRDMKLLHKAKEAIEVGRAACIGAHETLKEGWDILQEVQEFLNDDEFIRSYEQLMADRSGIVE